MNHKNLFLLLIFLIINALACKAQDLYKFPEGVYSHWNTAENPKGLKGAGGQSNQGRKGSPCISLKSKETYVLAEVQGTSGIIRRIWMTMDNRKEALRGLKLDFYWDNSMYPAVSVPLGDFFSQGLGKMNKLQSAFFSSPEGRSFNCFIPMPFKTGMKLVITNEMDKDVDALFYDIDYTTGDKLGDDMMYFHAYFNRQNPTEMLKDYQLLPEIKGKGRFLGVNIGVIADKKQYYSSWWGEGEVKIFLDGDTDFPTLCGTGTEDYIGTGWGQGQYNDPYQGCSFADYENMQYCFYRFHIPDPVYFNNNIMVTIQQIGCWDPRSKVQFANDKKPVNRTGDMKVIDFTTDEKTGDYGLFERRDDWSSCVYFYLDSPENKLPPLMPLEKRQEGLE